MKQLSFIEDMETNSPITLLDCLSEHIDIKEIIPYSVTRHYYKHTGRKHKYSLNIYQCSARAKTVFHYTRQSFNYSAFSDFGLIPVISLNRRNTNFDIPKPSFTNNYPCCPQDDSLPLKYCGITKEKNRATRFKYICPKAIATSNGYFHTCTSPCSNAACGYITTNMNLTILKRILSSQRQ